MSLFNGRFVVLIPDVAKQLERIATAVEGPPAPRRFPFKVVGVMEIPRRRESRMIATGNHFYDTVGLRLQLAPNGPTDAAPAWSSDTPDVTLTVSADGLTCDVFADTTVPSFTVMATAPVDNPNTPELEDISESFTGSFSHSKATSLGGSASEIPRT